MERVVRSGHEGYSMVCSSASIEIDTCFVLFKVKGRRKKREESCSKG